MYGSPGSRGKIDGTKSASAIMARIGKQPSGSALHSSSTNTLRWSGKTKRTS